MNSDRVEAATRGSTSDEADQEGVMAADEADLHDDIPGLPPGLGRMVARAAAGDESVMPQLCTLLERHPIVWESVGDLANRAEVALLQYLAGRDLFVHEATRRKMAALRAELAQNLAALSEVCDRVPGSTADQEGDREMSEDFAA